MLGWPGVNVPAGLTDDGLPIGVQLLGPANSEPLLISLAAQLEAEERWHERRPPARPRLIAPSWRRRARPSVRQRFTFVWVQLVSSRDLGVGVTLAAENERPALVGLESSQHPSSGPGPLASFSALSGAGRPARRIRHFAREEALAIPADRQRLALRHKVHPRREALRRVRRRLLEEDQRRALERIVRIVGADRDAPRGAAKRRLIRLRSAIAAVCGGRPHM